MRIYIFILLSLIMSQDSTSLSQEVDEAIQDYENLIEKFPEMKGLNFNLANIHSKTGDMESAMHQYEQALSSEDTQLRAHALYNMGNLQFENGNIKESSRLFREALKLSSKDEDILHNYALSQKVLKEQQEQEKQQDQDQDQDQEKGNKENKEGQEKQEQQQDSDQDQDDKNQGKQKSSEQKDSEKQKQEEGEFDEQKEEKEQNSKEVEKEEEKQSELQKSDEQKDEEKKGKQGEPQLKELTEEEKRNLQEAEAILNALKADKDNLKKKKYKAKGRIKLEKDW